MSRREAFAVGGEQWIVSDDTIKMHLTEPLMQSIFFTSYLDEIPRITAKKYIPIDGEIFKKHGEMASTDPMR